MLLSDKVFSIIAEHITLIGGYEKSAAEKKKKYRALPLDNPDRFVKLVDIWRKIPPSERQESRRAFDILKILFNQYGGLLNDDGTFQAKGFLGKILREWLNSTRLGPRMKDDYGRIKPEIQEDINALWMEIAIGGLDKRAQDLRMAMSRKIKEEGLDEGLIEGDYNEVLSESDIQNIGKHGRSYFFNIFKNWFRDSIDKIVLPTKTSPSVEELFYLYTNNKGEIVDRTLEKEGIRPDMHQVFIEMLSLPTSECVDNAGNKTGKWKIGVGPCTYNSKREADNKLQSITIRDLFAMHRIKFPSQARLDAPIGGEENLKLTDIVEGREMTPLQHQQEEEIQVRVNQAIESLYRKIAPSDGKKAALIKKILEAEFDLSSFRKGEGDAKMTAAIFGNELLEAGITEEPETVINTVEAIATDFVNETGVPVLTQSGLNKAITTEQYSGLSSDPRWEQIGVSKEKIDPLLYMIGRWFSAGNGYWAAKGAPNWKNSKHHKIKSVRREALLALMGDPSFQEILPIPQLQEIYKKYQANPQDKELKRIYNKFDDVVWQMVMEREAKVHLLLKQSNTYMDRFMAYIDAAQERHNRVATSLYDGLSRRASEEEMINRITRGINVR